MAVTGGLRAGSVRKQFVALTITVISGSLLAACGGSEQADGDSGSTLTVDTILNQSLDPASTRRSATTLNSTWPVYDRLVNVGESGEYVPMLATKWSFSDGGRTLTLELRTGATFSDGAAFDAEAVKANIARYQKEPETKAATASIKSVEVVDPDTVKLHLTRPDRAVLNSLAQPAPGAMVSPEALDNKDLDTHPVGTGAWVIEGFRPGQEAVYTRRTDEGGVWDSKSGKVDRIVLRSRSAEASNNAIRTGEADIVPFYGDESAISDVLGSGAVKLRATPTAMTIIGVYLDSAKEPFDDVRMRQAVNHAIDRQAIVDSFQPTTSPRVQAFPNVVNGFDPELEELYPHDREKATALVAEAGHPDGVDAGTFLVANLGQVPAMAQAVQANLAEAGIRIKLQSYDVGQLVTHYSKSNASGMLSYIAISSMEPGTNLAWLFQNPLYLPGGGVPDAVAKQIATVDDPAASEDERAERAGKVIEYATEQALYAPILQGIPGFLVADDVKGLEEDQWLLATYGAQDFRYVSLGM